MSDEQDAAWRGHVGLRVVTDEFAAHGASCENADPARANEESDDHENDAEQNLPPERGDDPGDDQDHGDDPQQSGHKTSQVQRLRNGERRSTQPPARAVVYTPRDDYVRRREV